MKFQDDSVAGIAVVHAGNSHWLDWVGGKELEMGRPEMDRMGQIGL